MTRRKAAPRKAPGAVPKATSTQPATQPTRDTRKEGLLGLTLFDKLFKGSSWHGWRVVTLAWFGLGDLMTDQDMALYTQLTGRSDRPMEPAKEGVYIVSRRGGKSYYVGRFLIPFYAAIREYTTFSPGEVGSVIVTCPDRDQAGVILNYAADALAEIPNIQITRRTQDKLVLSNSIEIVVATADFRTGPRSKTAVFYCVDEGAFLPTDDSASPDYELKRAAVPTLLTTGGPFLLVSSPYAARGLLHQGYTRHWGVDGSDVLCIKAPSLVMNPTLSVEALDRARREDPAAAVSELDGHFRSDASDLFPLSVLQGLVSPGVTERPPMPGVRYTGFLDPAGGSGTDAFALAISHRDVDGRVVLDLVTEVKPPFNPEVITAAFCGTLKKYSIRTAFSDFYAGEWPRIVFARYGIEVQTSALNKSELYAETVPMIMSGGCSLLDIPKAINQLATLQRMTGSGGKDKIDHKKNSHDDLANVLAGSLIFATRSIGSKALLPAEFVDCVNREAAGSRCCFLGTSPWLPSDAHCRKHCLGHRAVLPGWRQYQAQAAEGQVPSLTAREYLRSTFDMESSPLTNRAEWGDLIRDYENSLGL